MKLFTPATDHAFVAIRTRTLPYPGDSRRTKSSDGAVLYYGLNATARLGGAGDLDSSSNVLEVFERRSKTSRDSQVAFADYWHTTSGSAIRRSGCIAESTRDLRYSTPIVTRNYSMATSFRDDTLSAAARTHGGAWKIPGAADRGREGFYAAFKRGDGSSGEDAGSGCKQFGGDRIWDTLQKEQDPGSEWHAGTLGHSGG